MSIPILDIDFASPTFLANPYPTYQHILNSLPVCQLSSGQIVVSRYQDVSYVLQDPKIERITNDFREPAWLLESMHRKPILLTECPETHRQHRSLFRSALTNDVIDRLRPIMIQTINHLLDNVMDSPIDFIADVAFPYVAEIMYEVTGIHNQNLDQLRRWCHCIESVQSMGDNPPESFQKEYKALHGIFHEQYQKAIEQRRQNPQNDFVSLLVQQSTLTDAELRDGIDLMVFAGFDTTALQLGIIIDELFKNPQWLRSIKDNKHSIPSFIEEMNRYRGVSQASLRRSKNDLTLPSGQFVPANTVMWVSGAAANHDGTVFPDPEEFKLDRPNAKVHLNFGGGAGMCIGKKLAETEMQVAIDAIATRVSNIERVGSAIWKFPLTHRVIDELPIKLLS